ncbi:sigma 54-interacting transcriptional regulator [Burkholderia multivorans]|uniref:sigma 54-interacting transcriptional regulator n=1 Tax=Burkholderia multivorans TaxID=87883 RepID=UPI003BB1C929
MSARRVAHAPFVAINCGAIPATLLQGRAVRLRSAAHFTGANQRKIGACRSANGGTLVSRLRSAICRSRARRACCASCRKGKIERLGGACVGRGRGVRVICANARSTMEAALREGPVPRGSISSSLRAEDRGTAAARARPRYRGACAPTCSSVSKGDAHRRLRGFSPDAVAALYGYAWPGNVRELINRVRRAIVMSEGSDDHRGRSRAERLCGRSRRCRSSRRAKRPSGRRSKQALLRHRGPFRGRRARTGGVARDAVIG